MKREKGVCERQSSRAGRGRASEGAHRETGEDKKDEWVVERT